MNAMHNKLDLIKNYIDYIKRKPKEMKWFFLDSEKPRSFVVSGHRLKLLPLEYAIQYQKEEFYVHVNPDEQKVMFCAWDENYVEAKHTEEHINQSEGFMEWDKVEEIICNFLSNSMRELTTATTPFSDMGKLRAPPPYSEMGHKPKPGFGIGGGEEAEKYGTHTQPTTYGPTPLRRSDDKYCENHYADYYSAHRTDYVFGSPEYKEKEAFTNKLTSYMKEGRTTTAIDTIVDTFDKLNQEKRYTMMDSILGSLNTFGWDKLNVPTMLALLRSSRVATDELKKRKEFSEKVKSHIAKLRMTRAQAIVEQIEAK
jgi:hypothetical protein